MRLWRLVCLLGRPLRSLISAALVGVLMASCSLAGDPPRSIVMEALQTQIVATQASISESLGLDPMVNVPTVSRVRVDHQDTLQLEGERFVHLEGSFDWQLPRDSVRVDSGFELYLQLGPRGEGWTLARPVSGDGELAQRWLLYPLGLPSS